MSCAAKLNLKHGSCLFPKKTSIRFGFTRFTIWNATLLAFSHSANPKQENQESRRKQILSRNNVYVYVFLEATILNRKKKRVEKMKVCSPSKKAKKTLAGSAKYQIRFLKNGKRFIPYLVYQIYLENCVAPSASTLHHVPIKVKLMWSVTYKELFIRRN